MPCSRAWPWSGLSAPGGGRQHGDDWLAFLNAGLAQDDQFHAGFASGAYHSPGPEIDVDQVQRQRGKLDQTPQGGAMIEWVWPWMLLLAPLPWLVRRALPLARSQQPALRAPFYHEWQQLGAGQGARGGHVRMLPAVALWLLWLLLLLAAARPTWIGEAIEFPTAVAT